MRKRDDQYFIVCEWSDGERDVFYETPHGTAKDEADCEFVYRQMLEKFPQLYWSHRDVRRIAEQQPKLSVAKALSQYAPNVRGALAT
jgi:hypothetical protein